jgi:hypothetical protein
MRGKLEQGVNDVGKSRLLSGYARSKAEVGHCAVKVLDCTVGAVDAVAGAVVGVVAALGADTSAVLGLPFPSPSPFPFPFHRDPYDQDLAAQGCRTDP